MSPTMWIAIAGLITAITALVIAVHTILSLRKMRADYSRTGTVLIENVEAHHDGPIVVIYNPSKNADFPVLRDTLNTVAQMAGYGEAIWIATTTESPGETQARQALDLSPSLVIAAGGDGTVRHVAGQIAHSGVPLAIFPIGTGNLLARNLNLPLHDMQRMAEIAVTGRNRRIDVGWLSVGPSPQSSDQNLSQETDRLLSPSPLFTGKTPFLVISGIGFDAHVMAAANPNLKSAIGWSAYLLAGVQHLRDRKIKASLRIHDKHEAVNLEARSVMFANCGELAGGFVLAPYARPDDGWLDVAIVDTKGGLIGWTDLLRRVSLQTIGAAHTPVARAMPEIGSLDIRRFRTMTVTTTEPEQVEADGDLLGAAKEITVWVDHEALIVRVP